MRNFDLHTHTTSSDGLLTPTELINKAISIGLHGIAITDHDSIEGLKYVEILCPTKSDFKVIPGIELSCVFNSEEVHILGYFVDHENIMLHEYLSRLRAARWTRGEKILQKLIDLGLEIPKDQIIENSRENDFIGRANIARYLVHLGYVKSIAEAFELYLDAGRPAFVERYKLDIEDAINLIQSAGGISILAHPGLIKNSETVTYCIQKGIMGIECQHSKHTLDDFHKFNKMCNENNLISTGGSDFHGDEETLGTITSDIDLIPSFKERM